MITVQIAPHVKGSPAAASIEAAAVHVLEHQGAGEADLTVVLAGDEQLRRLNHDYLDLDAPTDVLSFPAGEIDPQTGLRYLGDVVVSLERARVQAEAGGHSLEAEVQLLVVHGVLHLLGHDHAGPGEKRRMWAAQSEVLERLGLPGSIVHD